MLTTQPKVADIIQSYFTSLNNIKACVCVCVCVCYGRGSQMLSNTWFSCLNVKC